MEKTKKKVVKKEVVKDLKVSSCPSGCCSPDKCCCKNKTFSFLMIIATVIIIFTLGACVGINLEHEKGDCARLKSFSGDGRIINSGFPMRNILENNIPTANTTTSATTDTKVIK